MLVARRTIRLRKLYRIGINVFALLAQVARQTRQESSSHEESDCITGAGDDPRDDLAIG